MRGCSWGVRVMADGERGDPCGPGTAALPDGMRGEIVGAMHTEQLGEEECLCMRFYQDVGICWSS